MLDVASGLCPSLPWLSAIVCSHLLSVPQRSKLFLSSFPRSKLFSRGAEFPQAIFLEHFFWLFTQLPRLAVQYACMRETSLNPRGIAWHYGGGLNGRGGVRTQPVLFALGGKIAVQFRTQSFNSGAKRKLPKDKAVPSLTSQSGRWVPEAPAGPDTLP